MARTVETFIAPEADRADGCPHPREVYNLIGHKQAEARFATLLESQKLHHAWMINGASGIGKSTLAYRMIRRVLGGVPQTAGQLDVPTSDPIAQRVQSLGHGDFLLIRRPYDPKTKKIRAEIPVTEARKISTFFSRKASEGGWRVCLIDSIDEMNRNATNAVLKTLEEPPEKALIILLTKAPGRLLPTIRSRCMDLRLKPVPDTELRDWLRANTQGDMNDIEAAACLAKGAPGKALSLVRNADTVLKPLRNFIAGFPRANPRTAHQISDMLSLQNASISYGLFWDCLQDILYAQAVYAVTGVWESAFKPIALERSSVVWMDLYNDLVRLRQAQAGLNMSKKTVLLHALSQIGR